MLCVPIPPNWAAKRAAIAQTLQHRISSPSATLAHVHAQPAPDAAVVSMAVTVATPLALPYAAPAEGSGGRKRAPGRPNATDIEDNERLYRCDAPGCNKAYASYTGLYQHRKKYHSDRLAPADSGTRGRKRPDVDQSGRRFVCDAPGCDKAYASSACLYQHRRIHHPEMIQSRSAALCSRSRPPKSQAVLQAVERAALPAPAAESESEGEAAKGQADERAALPAPAPAAESETSESETGSRAGGANGGAAEAGDAPPAQPAVPIAG